MINLDALEAAARAAGGASWSTDTGSGPVEGAHVWDEDGDAVCRTYTNIGAMPEPIDEVQVAEFIAAASPAVVLELIAIIRDRTKDVVHYDGELRAALQRIDAAAAALAVLRSDAKNNHQSNAARSTEEIASIFGIQLVDPAPNDRLDDVLPLPSEAAFADFVRRVQSGEGQPPVPAVESFRAIENAHAQLVADIAPPRRPLPLNLPASLELSVKPLLDHANEVAMQAFQSALPPGLTIEPVPLTTPPTCQRCSAMMFDGLVQRGLCSKCEALPDTEGGSHD